MVHDLRALLRLEVGYSEQPSTAILDGRTLRSTPENGERASYNGHKRKKGSKFIERLIRLTLKLLRRTNNAGSVGA